VVAEEQVIELAFAIAVQAVHASPAAFLKKPSLHVNNVGGLAEPHVYMALATTVSAAAQALHTAAVPVVSFQKPALQEAATESVPVAEQVVVKALAAAVQAVQIPSLSQVPATTGQVAVQVSLVPLVAIEASAPTVFLDVAVAHAETRLSELEVQV